MPGSDEPRPSPTEHPAPLRVAAVTADGGWPGAGIAIARLLAGLDRLGHAVRLYCDDDGVRAHAAALDVLVRRQPTGAGLAGRQARRFGAELERRAPDVALLAGRDALAAGVRAARRADVPRVVAWIDVETDLPGRPRQARAFEGVDAVIVPTGAMRRRLLDALPDLAGDVEVIPPGVPAPDPRGGLAHRAMLGVPLGAPLIAAAGPLTERKRYDRLIRVLAGLPDAHGLLLGDGPDRRRLERLAGRFGVVDRLRLPGYQADLGPALDAADVFLVTSDGEGLSRAMLEAMAAGVPVVSTPVSGAAEALDPAGSTGARPGVVTSFDVDALVDAVRGLLADRQRLRSMGEAAREAARTRFDEATMLARWDAVLAGGARP